MLLSYKDICRRAPATWDILNTGSWCSERPCVWKIFEIIYYEFLTSTNSSEDEI